MTKQTQPLSFIPPFADFPAAFQAFWNLKNPAGAAAPVDFAAWMKDFAKLQEESLRFMRERFAEQVKAATAIAACKTPAEALDLQMKFANTTMNEYMAEGKKLLETYGPQTAARRQ